MAEDNKAREGIDLSGAFKDSGTGVKFEDSGWAPHYRAPVVPKMVQWTMKLSNGLVKDERQAQYVLLAFAVVVFAVSLYLFFSGGSAVKTPSKYREDIAPEVRAKIPPEILKTLPSRNTP